ncbi:MAG: site-specific DNA-methyltransferase [Chloroflexi bacterium]|nr:site-specific DNA-methyltransferase [Chloroflexota bacterium]MYK34468.1 site-specific DNA-methyltransferase [Chloroflexota bacterium]
MPPKRRPPQSKRPIESYDHRDKDRLNNPPVGLVTPETDRDAGRRTYTYDYHLDPQLQWAGKAEHTSFEVPTVSLHVHERVDPRTIIEATRKRNDDGTPVQGSLFELPEENPPVRSAIEFYRHRHNWTNRLVAGDSLLVMNSLLEKEGMAGKVQMVYIDPPYGIRYGSNFQPFVNKRDVRNGKDEDLTQEPETIKAFRDTWELGIHSYLSYLRDRLLLARELLTESGSCFVQIGDENVHIIRSLMDEVFGYENSIAQVSFRKKLMPLGSKTLEGMADYLVWYAKDKSKVKYNQLYIGTEPDPRGRWTGVLQGSGEFRRLTPDERKNFSRIPADCKIFGTVSQWAPSFSESNVYAFEFHGKEYLPTPGQCWITSKEKMGVLARINRLYVEGDFPRYVNYHDDFPYRKLTHPWHDTAPAQGKEYVVETNEGVVARCLLMTTDPGDLVFDPTCGSGTTAYAAEQWGRRWITCDTSRVAISLAKQRLMTALFNYYELAHPDEGVGSGFKYKVVPHISLSSIVNNPDIEEGMTSAEIDAAIKHHAPQETLYDQPLVDNGKRRVTGPFSVEAVPAPAVRPIDDIDDAEPLPADDTVARSGETLRQADWRDELLRTGIRGKAGQFIRFARLEPLPDYRYLHADGESLPNNDGAWVFRDGAASASQRIVVSFGPDHAPLEQRQVNQALQEAETLRPTPKVIVFAAFQFDPEAAKDIDETNWPGLTLLKAQMNADLLTEDLKKKRASNESFWLIGQPDVRVEAMGDSEGEGKYRVTVQGFDYYNTKTGNVESGGQYQIAMWMLDTDYDGRSLFPRQVFFPMAGDSDGWARLARNLRAEIDEELIEAYRGTVSLPFDAGENRRVAVKIVDDRGIESLKVMALETETPVTKPERTLEEIVAGRFKEIPREEWERLPDDLIDNLDHYTAGADPR